MKHILYIAFILISLPLIGQRIIQPKLVELDLKGVVYNDETSFDLKIHENGFAVAYNKAEILTYYKSKFYQVEVGMMRDPREKRQNKSGITVYDTNSFVFGKINNLINVRASLGFKRYLSEKAKRKGLAVGYSYGFGPVIGLLKPYQLDLLIRDDSEAGAGVVRIQSEAYSEENAERFLNTNDIFGASSFFKGFNKISVVPGIQAKVASHFALGAFDKYVKAVEIGVMLDLYIKKVDILLQSDEISNKPYFLKLFVVGQFGYRK